MARNIWVLALGTVWLLNARSALAQGYRSENPNLGHFYMGRQEWQYVDESPVIRGQPGAPVGQQGAGPAPAGPMPLPKAGFMPYSSTIPSVRDALPKVNNGVPKPMPAAAAGPSGMKGRAGSLKPKQAASAGPQGLKTYTPYKGYGGAPATAAAGGGGSASTSTRVSGSVLHWARPKARSY